ncbi:NAD(P)/FAD-dependent oxidoreductase [Oceaniglobus ichthyenteri]|uniref:NAD(P)/FAD-dependent oxidoreductase n=1 Tax=Oceaniglobus ichthyenteri TaxID=2136177 RepID=UPI000D397BC2|nr:FAD-binding oxidoreductase [Oceaniglobus ichthyenteri]
MSAPDVLIIGAGITGAVAALTLAEAGHRVDIIDAYAPAAMASGWTLAGVRQSGRDPAELPLARAAVAEWSGLEARLGAPTHYRQGGNLRLARTEPELATIRALVADQRRAGLDLWLLTPDDLRDMAPGLSPDILGASFCPTDGHADPVATVRGFIDAALRHGARTAWGERAQAFETEHGRITAVLTDKRRITPGAVLLAAGIQVNTLLAPLGPVIPLRHPIVTVVQTQPVTARFPFVIGVANADFALRQEVSGQLRFTSGAEPGGVLAEQGNRPVVRPTLASVTATLTRAAKIMPDTANATVNAIWGGLLDLTPDALPVIDRHPDIANLTIAAGFSGHGFGIGPVTGALAGDLVLGRDPAHPVAAFRFDRWDGTGPDAGLSLHG